MNDDFYIGYRGLPEGQRRFLKPWLWILGLGLPLLAALLSLHFLPLQASTWDDTPSELDGWLTDAPVPILQTPQGGLLLVEEGKFGAEPRIKAMAGHLPLHVHAKGLLLHGFGKAMLELEAGPQSLSPSAASGPAPRLSRHFGATRSLRGEILDSKCYLGAMKPGFSKIHRECAMRCLSGGVPALFHASDGQLYLMQDRQGKALGAELAELAGLPVKLDAEILESGGWRILITDPARIEALSRH